MARKAYLNYKKEQWRPKVGAYRQLAGIQPFVFADGKAKGLRAFDVRNGRLRFTVLADRGMDIGQVECDGIPMAWISPVGYASGEYFEPAGTGWLRSFSGGLLTTCGLTQAGEPCRDGEEELGLHGRISNLPARKTAYEEEWVGEEYRLSVRGCVEQASVFHEQLELKRSIKTVFGSNVIKIEDEVINQGFTAAPLMLLYHINLGFPLVDEGSSIVGSIRKVRAWEGTPEADLEHYSLIPGPSGTVDEEVIHAEVEPDENGKCHLMLVNPREDIAFVYSYDSRQFPRFSLWKGIKQGIYAIGFEPANCGLNGRAAERREGRLEQLLPHEKRTFESEFMFLTTREEIETVWREKFGSREI